LVLDTKTQTWPLLGQSSCRPGGKSTYFYN
jgi:hypothetical protein